MLHTSYQAKIAQLCSRIECGAAVLLSHHRDVCDPTGAPSTARSMLLSGGNRGSGACQDSNNGSWWGRMSCPRSEALTALVNTVSMRKRQKAGSFHYVMLISPFGSSSQLQSLCLDLHPTGTSVRAGYTNRRPTLAPQPGAYSVHDP